MSNFDRQGNWKPESSIGGWDFSRVTSRVIHYTLIGKSITLTGSDVDTDSFKPRFPHIFQKVTLKHTDSVKADSATAMTATIFRKNAHGLFEEIWKVTGAIGDVIVVFDLNESQYEAQDYRIRLNGTNTDLVFPCIYLQGIA